MMKPSVILSVLCFLGNFRTGFSQARHDCKSFKKVWSTQNCPNTVNPKKRRYCKTNEFQVVTVSSLDLVEISCQNVRPDVEIFQCLGIARAEFLHIKDCSLSEFDFGIMTSDSEVKKIEITSSKRIGVVTRAITFNKVKNLETIMFSGYIDIVPGIHSLFPSVATFKYLSITDHKMTGFPASNLPLPRTENLKYLSYRKGLLKSIEKHTFDELATLTSLDLSYNSLKNLHGQTFSKLSNLRTLDLTYNKLQYISSSLQPLITLESLKLGYNSEIRLAPTSPFGSSRRLSTVEVNHCNIDDFPNIDWSLSTLKLVNVSYNSIKQLTLPLNTAANTKVDVRWNGVEIIILKKLNKSLTYSPSYIIANNTLKWICKARRNVFVNIVDGRSCAFPSSKPYDLSVSLNSSVPVCPQKCQCSTAKDGVVVDCKGKGLMSVPLRFPRKTTKILLSNNRLTSLSPYQKSEWRSVRYVELNRNQIKTLPSAFMYQVDSTRDFRLFLADNSWQCGCQYIYFLRWFHRNKRKILDRSNTYCSMVLRNATTISLVLDVDIKQLLCHSDAYSTITPQATISVGVILSLLFVFLLCACYCNRKSLSLLWYCCNFQSVWQETQRRLKPFDAFVVYHPSDRPKVDDLIKNLEPSIHLCLHEREWLPDLEIAHHISISFQTSRKTLVLISRSLVDSIWFQDFTEVYIREMKPLRDNIMLISIDEIDDIDDLHPDIAFLFVDRMQLHWGERLFWPKLRYFLYSTDKTIEKEVNEV